MAIKDLVLQGFGASDRYTIFTRGLKSGILPSGLAITGNGVSIPTDSSASVAAGTQWDTLFLNDREEAHQFNIENTSSGSRTIQSVTFTPSTKFSAIIPTTIAAGETKRLIVSLNPDAAGSYTSILSLLISGYAPYTFTVAGTVSSLDPSRNTYGRSTIGPAQ